ncbi:hypothetical protein EBT16_00610 [bacterium]|nr:hypothetical protein [bacterium]
MKFQRKHAETLPLDVVVEICSKGRTTWWSSRTLQKFIFKESHGSPRGIDGRQKNFEFSAKEWANQNRAELEAILIARSPRAACKLATDTDRRMTPQNEKGFQKACYASQKDKRWWLKYCSHFRIIPDNHHVILLETYGEQDQKQKEHTKKYLEKLKEAKEETLKFIREVLESENIGLDRPIEELVEALKR